MHKKLEALVNSLIELISFTIQKATDKPTESDMDAINSLSMTLCSLISLVLF